MITKTFPYRNAKYRLVRDGIEFHIQERKRYFLFKDWETIWTFSSKEAAIRCIDELCSQPELTKEIISYHSPYNT